MKDLDKLYMEVLEDVMNSGVTPGSITGVSVDRRARKRAGVCIRHNRIGTYEIKISAFVLADDVAEQNVKNVIAHEIIHTVEGCMNHGYEWKKQAAVVMGYKPEYSIKRVEEASSVGLTPEKRLESARYVYKCTGCGIIVTRNRASRFTDQTWRYRCGACGGKFTAIRVPDDRQVLVAACRFPS